MRFISILFVFLVGCGESRPACVVSMKIEGKEVNLRSGEEEVFCLEFDSAKEMSVDVYKRTASKRSDINLTITSAPIGVPQPLLLPNELSVSLMNCSAWMDDSEVTWLEGFDDKPRGSVPTFWRLSFDARCISNGARFSAIVEITKPAYEGAGL